MREIILDTETTGIDFNENRIVEIGCIELIDFVPTQNKFQVYCNPKMNIPQRVIDVHGITNEFLENKPKFEEIVDNFLEYIQNDPLVMHNARFDVGFLNKELEKIGRNPIKNKIIDTLQIAKKKFPKEKVNLNALCKKYNISLIERSYHGALLDAKLLSEVYLHLIDKKDLMIQLEVQEDYLNNMVMTVEKNFLQERSQFFFEKDNRLHEDFLKKSVPNAKWNVIFENKGK